MTKREVVNFRMTELEVTKLDYIRQPNETRSAAIRRLINDTWFDEMMRFDQEHGSSISDRVNCL
jgi:hypothetical protein